MRLDLTGLATLPMSTEICIDCERPPSKAGPLTRGMCQYCAREKRCYVCGADATETGTMGQLCAAKTCAAADKVASLHHYS